MLFLGVATISAWAQDAILEPFGAEVLGATLAQTTRYSSYWQGATAVFLIFFAFAWQMRSTSRELRITLIGVIVTALGGLLLVANRFAPAVPIVPAWILVGVGATILSFGIFALIAQKYWKDRLPEQQIPLSQIGLALMGIGMVLLAITSLSTISWIVNPALLVFGIGFGFYTFSAFNLLVVMTSDRAAGAYLGLWTVTILLTRGLGILGGGFLRDTLYNLLGSHSLSYGIIFGLEGLGLFVSMLLLTRVNFVGFAREAGRISATDAAVIAAEV